MAKRKANHTVYKHAGGFVGLPKRVFKSEEYKGLSLAARCILDELQDRYTPQRNGRLVYSIGQAMKNLKISYNPASHAFTELEEKGFIQRSFEADYSVGKAREWCLTFQPRNGREPTDEWCKPTT